jgi:hypothetical protein
VTSKKIKISLKSVESQNAVSDCTLLLDTRQSVNLVYQGFQICIFCNGVLSHKLTKNWNLANKVQVSPSQLKLSRFKTFVKILEDSHSSKRQKSVIFLYKSVQTRQIKRNSFFQGLFLHCFLQRYVFLQAHNRDFYKKQSNCRNNLTSLTCA